MVILRAQGLAVALLCILACASPGICQKNIIGDKGQTRKHVGSARWFVDKGYYDMAERHYKYALNISPNHFVANKELGELYYFKIHDIPAAVIYLEIAIHNMPRGKLTYAGLYVSAGEVCHFMGRFEDAIKWFQKALKLIDKIEKNITGSDYETINRQWCAELKKEGIPAEKRNDLVSEINEATYDGIKKKWSY